MSQAIIRGPIAQRHFTLDKACEEGIGHAHNYDHTTVVISGRLKISYEYNRDGQTITGESGAFGPGETCVIKAGVRHKLIALENNTRYVCVFSHRDFGGVVVETFAAAMNNQQAYD